jgi:hypothetical protein
MRLPESFQLGLVLHRLELGHRGSFHDRSLRVPEPDPDPFVHGLLIDPDLTFLPRESFQEGAELIVRMELGDPEELPLGGRRHFVLVDEDVGLVHTDDGICDEYGIVIHIAPAQVEGPCYGIQRAQDQRGCPMLPHPLAYSAKFFRNALAGVLLR